MHAENTNVHAKRHAFMIVFLSSLGKAKQFIIANARISRWSPTTFPHSEISQ